MGSSLVGSSLVGLSLMRLQIHHQGRKYILIPANIPSLLLNVQVLGAALQAGHLQDDKRSRIVSSQLYSNPNTLLCSTQ